MKPESARPNVRMTVYLPADLAETYKVAAVKQQMSLSQLVEIALVSALGGEVQIDPRTGPRGGQGR